MNYKVLFMKDQILSNLRNPAQLESMYRSDKSAFTRAFNALFPELKDNTIAEFWNARLNFNKEEITWGSRADLLFVIIASLIAGFISKLPDFLNISDEYFFPRNIGFIVFPFLTTYFAWKNKLSTQKIAVIAVLTLGALFYINFLPDLPESDTLILSCIHLVLFLWSILGFAFVGSVRNDSEKRMGLLSFNGDLLVMCALIVISGAILSGITIGLFSLIGINIEIFYQENVIPFGLSAVPILGTFLIRTNPQLVGKVSPVIARIFSPIVLLMLVIYLIAIIYSGKDPYNDREFLMMFNALLIGVMAIIFFSVAERSKGVSNRFEIWVLLLLSILTIVVNGIALSAIVFRISEWGITPNRAAVLGSNLLFLGNLLIVAGQLIKVATGKTELRAVGRSISSYLPIYFAWTVIVTFLFPWIFGM